MLKYFSSTLVLSHWEIVSNIDKKGARLRLVSPELKNEKGLIMAKNYRSRVPNYLKTFKEKKEDVQPHIITPYEQQLLTILGPAIQSKQMIRFWYEDETSDFKDWRLVEPHLIGQTKYKTANILLSGWFLPTAEQLLNGHEAKWGNYILNNIKQLEVSGQKFIGSRPLYNSNDSRMIKIFCATH